MHMTISSTLSMLGLAMDIDGISSTHLFLGFRPSKVGVQIWHVPSVEIVDGAVSNRQLFRVYDKIESGNIYAHVSLIIFN